MGKQYYILPGETEDGTVKIAAELSLKDDVFTAKLASADLGSLFNSTCSDCNQSMK